MRILLLGGYQYAYGLLARLVERKETVVGCLVPEEDPHERVRFVELIELLCRQYGIPVRRTSSLQKSDAAWIAAEFAPEVIFCYGWRRVLPSEVLAIPPRGVVAAHHALLPKLRGFAPVNWAMLLGHERVGTTLFHMGPGFDEGNIYFQESIPVGPDDTLATMMGRLCTVSVNLFERWLEAAREGSLQSVVQQDAAATYTCSRTPEDGEIDWSASTTEIVRLVRSLGPPRPPAYTYCRGTIVKVLKAAAVDNPLHYEGRICGRVVARDPARGTVDVLSGDGMVRILQVETDGEGVCSAADVFRSVFGFLGIRVAVEIAELRRRVAQLESAQRRAQRQMAAAGGSPADAPYPPEDNPPAPPIAEDPGTECPPGAP